MRMKLKARRTYEQDALADHYDRFYGHVNELVDAVAEALAAAGVGGKVRGEVMPREVERSGGRLVLHPPRPMPTEPRKGDELVPVVTLHLRGEEAARLIEALTAGDARDTDHG